jgi:hypothetical protein
LSKKKSRRPEAIGVFRVTSDGHIPKSALRPHSSTEGSREGVF